MPDPLARFRAELPDGLTPLAEKLGWQCPCGGQMVLPVAPADTAAADRAVDLLLDAARTHHNNCD